MRRLSLAFLLILTLVAAPNLFAQAQASPPPKLKERPVPQREDDDEDEERAALPNSNVPPNAPVITIEGLCDSPKTGTAAKSECKTIITRSEFEKLANTLQPGMPPQVRKQLANAYPRLLVMSKEAQKRGIDKDPHYLESVKFAKMQLLNQELNRRLQEEAAKIPEKDLQDYYDKNSKSFEQAALQRVFVPRTKQTEATPVDAKDLDAQKAKEKEAEDAMTKVAEELRARAAAGEDFDKLEKDAYDAAGIKANPPSTTIPKIRRANLPQSQAVVFDLNPGEVSQVINDPSGHYIYKLQSKSVPPFDEVKQEIHANLQNQRMRSEMQKMQESVTTDLNEAYFNGAPAAPAGAAQPAPAANANQPAAKADPK